MPRGLLPRRLREQGARARVGRADPGRQVRRGRGAATDVLGRAGDVSTRERLGDLLHDLAPQVLGVLLRRHGRFDACEDAVQEALLAATTQWPNEGVPDNTHA